MSDFVNNLQREKEQINCLQQSNWTRFNVFKSRNTGGSLTISKRGKSFRVERGEAKKLCHALNVYLKRDTKDEDPVDTPYTSQTESVCVWWEPSTSKRAGSGVIHIGTWHGGLWIYTFRIQFLIQSLLDCFLLMSYKKTLDLDLLKTKLRIAPLQVHDVPGIRYVMDRSGGEFKFCHVKLTWNEDLDGTRCESCRTKPFNDAWSAWASEYYTRKNIDPIWTQGSDCEILNIRRGMYVPEKFTDGETVCCQDLLEISKQTENNSQKIYLTRDKVFFCILRLLEICEWRQNILFKQGAVEMLSAFEAAYNTKFPETVEPKQP